MKPSPRPAQFDFPAIFAKQRNRYFFADMRFDQRRVSSSAVRSAADPEETP
jgi:hypothetical protein